MSVYFITCRALNMVKIGYASRPRARFIGIRVCCPLEVELELVLDGAKAEEKALHAILKRHRVRGEWFYITPEIEGLIANPPERPHDIAELNLAPEELDQHDRLERIELEQWLRRHSKVNVSFDAKEAKRRHLLRELASLEAA